MKQKWSDILTDAKHAGKWFALTECDYNYRPDAEGESLDTCLVLDEDHNLAALEERIARKGLRFCLIKFCGEEPECSESPRMTRSTSTTPPK